MVIALLIVLSVPDFLSASSVGEDGNRIRGSRIAAGPRGQHACAIKEDGTVRCWGSNSFGQLGNNSGGFGQFSATPVQVSNLNDAVALAAGDAHTCALKGTGGVVCWGNDFAGQLGDGAFGQKSVPVPVLNPDGTQLTGVIAIGAGGNHSCAVRIDGTVRCWGLNFRGMLGDSSRNPDTFVNSPFAITVTGLTDAVGVALGSGHTCAVRVNGLVMCWGSNSLGELGQGFIDIQHVSATQVTDLDDVVGMAAGDNHNCAVRANGGVRCWGRNDFGQIGDGTISVPRSSPTAVNGLGLVVTLALGQDHSCARRADGEVRCWGRNDKGQLGDGTTTTQPFQITVVDHFAFKDFTFVPVSLLDTESLGAGLKHNCAVQVDDEIFCWGANDIGQLGNTTTAAPSFPSVVAQVSGSGGTVSGRFISAGGNQTCARRADGSVACWGSDLQPAAVTGFTRTLAVVAGSSHKCALRSDGIVRCIGSNRFGQIGNGAGGSTAPDVTDPAQGVVSNLTDITSIAAGDDFTCALRVTGTVRCWGRNTFGQLGNGVGGFQGLGAFEPEPVLVGGLSTIVAIAAGGSHACAVRVDGHVFCWGFNTNGQVGSPVANSIVGTATEVNSTTALTNVVAIAAGPSHSCALQVNGTAKCWGKDDVGQLGNSTSDFDTVFASFHRNPDDVDNLSDGVDLAGGGSIVIPSTPSGQPLVRSDDFTCARRVGGTVRCFGDNGHGQLGDGTTTDHLSPVTSVQKRAVGCCINGGIFFITSTVTGVSGITAGNSSGCALLANGQPFCWGNGSLFAAPVASFAFNIARNVQLSNNRVAQVTVLANCTEGQQLRLDVQLTQDGVVGEGHVIGECTGNLTGYPVTDPAQGRVGFAEGPALAHAHADVVVNGQTVETDDWTRQVNVIAGP